MNFDFKMSGGLGDIIYALPTIRALGGGSLCICPSAYTDNALHSGNGAVLAEAFHTLPYFLTNCTDYVKRVEVCEEEQPARFDLNAFRSRSGLQGPPTLAAMILEHFSRSHFEANRSWLSIDAGGVPGYPFKARPHEVVIHRTARYHNPSFPWRDILRVYGQCAVFLGTSEERALFVDEFGFVVHCVTPTLYHFAWQIANAKLFIGNQSVGYAIAEGFKQRAILEECEQCPNCNFGRSEVSINPQPEQLPVL